MNEVIIKTNDEFKKFHSSTVKTKLMSLIRVLLSLKRVAWTYKYKEKKDHWNVQSMNEEYFTIQIYIT